MCCTTLLKKGSPSSRSTLVGPTVPHRWCAQICHHTTRDHCVSPPQPQPTAQLLPYHSATPQLQPRRLCAAAVCGSCVGGCVGGGGLLTRLDAVKYQVNQLLDAHRACTRT